MTPSKTPQQYYLVEYVIDKGTSNETVVPLTPASILPVEYEFKSVTADHTIEVTFGKVFYTHSSDDADEDKFGQVNVTRTGIPVNNEDNTTSGFRFKGFQINQNCDIFTGVLVFQTVSSMQTGGELELEIWAQYVKSPAGDPPAFSESSYNISNRLSDLNYSVTSSVKWKWAVTNIYPRINVTDMLQEIIDSSDWTPKSPINFIIKVIGGSGSRGIISYDGGGSLAPMLSIVYNDDSCEIPTTTTTIETTTTTTLPTTTTTLLPTTTTTLPTTTTTRPTTTTTRPSTTTTTTTTTTSTTTTTTSSTTTSSATTTTTGVPPTTTTISGTTPTTIYVCLPISDIPLEASTKTAAAANLMFILDTSSSMDSSFMAKPKDQSTAGTLKIEGGSDKWWRRYVFDEAADGVNYYDKTWNPGAIMPKCERNRWQTQWAGYNYIYYDPATTYEPWPTYENADLDSPKADPLKTPTFDLSQPYVYIIDGACSCQYSDDSTVTRNMIDLHFYKNDKGECEGQVFNPDAPGAPDAYKIIRAHYYVKKGERIFLVQLIGSGESGEVKYAEFNDENKNNLVDYGELTDVSNPSLLAIRRYKEERQNFANWFTYYRKRFLTAKAAIARVIDAMEGVKIGLSNIHTYDPTKQVYAPNVRQPVTDDYKSLFPILYKMQMAGATPLREALNRVGQYFDARSGAGDGGFGAAPYAENGAECQQNFAILVTDGSYNGDFTGIANTDGDGNTAFDGGNYADTSESTLADVAMEYYENDLAPDIGNMVPDEATHQHMVTYTVAFGVEGTIRYDPDCPPNCPGTVLSEWPAWPAITSGVPNNPTEEAKRIDDLWHAAINGRGKFISAKSTQQLVDALAAITEDIGKRIGPGSAVALNSQKLQAGTFLYEAKYDTDGWAGDVLAYELDPATGNVKVTGDNIYTWSAAKKLDAMVDPVSERTVFTYNGADSGIAFEFSSLTDEQKTLLNSAKDESAITAIIAYLKGDHTYEGTNFRARTNEKLGKRLGDVVHASPLSNNKVVYVGANDGMLHAFSNADGSEIFAYIPNLVFENLIQLTRTPYSHTYFVDATPYVATIDESSDPKTRLLVGGLGKGGKGYYCLDVSDVAATSGEGVTYSPITAEDVKWEYPKNDTPKTDVDDVGYSYSTGYVVQSNKGGKWVVIFGNGYDSPNAKAVLFILDAMTGELIKKIDTGVGPDPALAAFDSATPCDATRCKQSTGCNGLSTPLLIDPNMDNTVDYAYAGDLQGNLWKFDLTSTSSDDWDIAYKDGSGKYPLFQAKDKLGNPQPITTEPDAMYHCDDTKMGYIVVFGTGRYLTAPPADPNDLQDTKTQSIYGVWDWQEEWETVKTKDEAATKYLGPRAPGDSNEETFSLPLAHITDSALIEQTSEDIPGYRTLSANKPLWFGVPDEGGHVGWYFDLPDEGERVLSQVTIRDGVALVVSRTPSSKAGSSPCVAGSGTSIIYAINACSGAQVDYFDINNDGTMDAVSGMKIDGDVYGVSPVSDPNNPNADRLYYTGPDPDGNIPTAGIAPLSSRVFYWREMEY